MLATAIMKNHNCVACNNSVTLRFYMNFPKCIIKLILHQFNHIILYNIIHVCITYTQWFAEHDHPFIIYNNAIIYTFIYGIFLSSSILW